MTNILGQVAKSHHSKFQPSSPDEHFALSLARRMGEPAAAPHYVVLASQHSESTLRCAYKKAVETNPDRIAAVFHEILAASNGHGNRSLPRHRLMAIRVERRALAMTLFTGTHLEGWRVRQLPSEAKRAEDSCAGFVRAVLDEHSCESAVLEAASGEMARATLHSLVVEQCRMLGISVSAIPKQAVIESFAHPSPTTRDQVRQIISRMWLVPSLKGGRDYVLDAAALGLYVQTERLFEAEFQQ